MRENGIQIEASVLAKFVKFLVYSDPIWFTAHCPSYYITVATEVQAAELWFPQGHRRGKAWTGPCKWKRRESKLAMNIDSLLGWII